MQDPKSVLDRVHYSRRTRTGRVVPPARWAPPFPISGILARHSKIQCAQFGYFWEGVAQLLVDTEAPSLKQRFEYDSEGGMFVAYGSDRPALDELAALVAAVMADAGRLRQIVALAEERNFEFDD